MKCFTYVMLIMMTAYFSGCSKNSCGKYNLITDAACHGDARAVECLIREGQDVQFRNSDGHSAIYYAARYGNLKTVKVLLKHGANVNDTGGSYLPNQGMPHTPLTAAIVTGRKEIAECLIKNGADVNLRNPLHAAVIYNYKSLVLLLLENGADPNQRDRQGKAPLDFALEDGNTEIAEILRVYSTGDKTKYTNLKSDSYQYADINEAAKNGDAEAVKQLLKDGQSANSQDKFGLSPMHFAAQSGSIDTIKILLQHGGNVNIDGIGGWTPLFYAVGKQDVKMARFLIENGATVELQDELERTPLQIALKKGNRKMIDLLKLNGARE